jgi:hypothetical protein
VYVFVNSANKEVLQSGGSATYQLTKANIGMALSCEVLASNAGGTGVARTVALPAITSSEESGNGLGPGAPYESKPSQGAIESGNEASARALKEYEAQRAVQERKAREEAEAIEQAQREVESREVGSAKTAAERCVVPSLKGDSLSKARHALNKAHCKLGKVTMSRGSSGSSLVVTHQKTAPGKRLPVWTRVAVTIGHKK